MNENKKRGRPKSELTKEERQKEYTKKYKQKNNIQSIHIPIYIDNIKKLEELSKIQNLTRYKIINKLIETEYKRINKQGQSEKNPK